MSRCKSFFLALLMALGWNAAAAVPAPEAPASTTSTNLLVWTPTNQTYNASVGDISAHFTFWVSNRSSAQVVIDDVKPSCGCTVAQLPSKPWRLAPGETNHMEVLVDLRNKAYGRYFKTITVLSSNSPGLLTLVLDIPQNTNGNPNSASLKMVNRIWGQQLAAMDHQAVFKNDCVKCHLEPAFGKHGEQLYRVACGICHEAEHRATMVPDLHALKTPIPDDYWRSWVTYGKPGTLMPGFAATLGGPLDSEQIKSLVDYLKTAFPRPSLSGTDDPGEDQD